MPEVKGVFVITEGPSDPDVVTTLIAAEVWSRFSRLGYGDGRRNANIICLPIYSYLSNRNVEVEDIFPIIRVIRATAAANLVRSAITNNSVICRYERSDNREYVVISAIEASKIVHTHLVNTAQRGQSGYRGVISALERLYRLGIVEEGLENSIIITGAIDVDVLEDLNYIGRRGLRIIAHRNGGAWYEIDYETNGQRVQRVPLVVLGRHDGRYKAMEDLYQCIIERLLLNNQIKGVLDSPIRVYAAVTKGVDGGKTNEYIKMIIEDRFGVRVEVLGNYLRPDVPLTLFRKLKYFNLKTSWMVDFSDVLTAAETCIRTSPLTHSSISELVDLMERL